MAYTAHTARIGFSAAIAALVLAVLVKYWFTILESPWAIAGVYSFLPLPLLPFAVIAAGGATLFLAGLWRGYSRAGTAMAALGAQSLIVTAMAADHWLWLKFLLFFGTLVFIAFSGQGLARRFFATNLPYALGFPIGMVALSLWQFVMGVASTYHPLTVYPVILLITAHGAWEGWKRRSQFASQCREYFATLDIAGFVALWLTWILLASAFVAASAPETYSDAMRSHIPYIMSLVREGGLLPNYAWVSHLMPAPFHVAAAAAAMALGELGVKWLFWFLGLVSLLMLVSETWSLTRNATLATGTGLFFFAAPFHWVWLTTAYQDMSIGAFSFAGVMAIRRFVDGEKGALYVAGLLLGFAFVAKYHIAFLIAGAAISFFLFRYADSIHAFRGALIRFPMAAGLFLLSVAPWLLLVGAWTGNPFFPFFDLLFHSSLYTDSFQSMLAYTRLYGIQIFQFPFGIVDLITWPWSMTYKTGALGETVNGSMGFMPLLVAPLLLFLIFGPGARMRPARTGLVYLLVAYIMVTGTALTLKASYLRYFMPVAFLVAVAISVGLHMALGLIRQRLPRNFPSHLGLILMILAVTLLGGWGIRLNFGAPDGLGWALYRGRMTIAEYIGEPEFAVKKYINGKLEPGESVNTIHYPNMNLLNCRAYEIMEWYDPARGLFSLADYEQFSKRMNIRFWIVRDRPWPKESPFPWFPRYKALGLQDRFWNEDRLVYVEPPFSVYTMKPAKDAEDIGAWKNQKIVEMFLDNRLSSEDAVGWMVVGDGAVPLRKGWPAGDSGDQIVRRLSAPQNASLVSGEISLVGDTPGGVLLADLIFLRQGKETGRRVANVHAERNAVTIRFESSIPRSSDSLTLIIRPWRPQDGTVSVGRGVIRWRWKPDPDVASSASR